MFKRFLLARGHARIAALVAATALVLASCSATRPTVEEWQPTWDQLLAAVPSESVIGENPPKSICDETLAFLRSNQARLFPTPDPAIDDSVRDWVGIAEDAFFECPPRNEHVGSFTEAYALLARFESEIESVLEMDRAS